MSAEKRKIQRKSGNSYRHLILLNKVLNVNPNIYKTSFHTQNDMNQICSDWTKNVAQTLKKQKQKSTDIRKLGKATAIATYLNLKYKNMMGHRSGKI